MNQINWSTYVGVVGVTVVVYYSLGYLLIIRKGKRDSDKARSQKAGKVMLKRQPEMEGRRDTQTKQKTDPASESSLILQAQVHDLVAELQAFIRQAGLESSEKDPVLMSLRSILGKYPQVGGSVFQEGIRNLIAITIEEHCAFRLSADELAALWDGEKA